MAVSAGQNQRPPELKMVELALNHATQAELQTYIKALANPTTVEGWVNPALEPLLTFLDAARGWPPAKQQAAQRLAAQKWFGIGGPHQWKPKGKPTKTFEKATADVLTQIAQYRLDHGVQVTLQIACRVPADIDIEGPNGNLFTITVPYSNATFALMRADRAGIGSDTQDVDLALATLADPREEALQDVRQVPMEELVPWDPEDPVRILTDLQGNVLAGHGRDATHVRFLRFGANDRPWLEAIGAELTSAYDQLSDADLARTSDPALAQQAPFVGLYLSPAAFTRLGGRDWLPAVDPHFDGNHSPIERLGEVGGGRADGAHDADALLLVAAGDPTTARGRADVLVGLVDGGVSEVGAVDGETLPESKEPFGFVDGISDPAIMLTTALRQLKDVPILPLWRPTFPIEQVMTPTVLPTDQRSAASYLAYAKFAQDLDAFDAAGPSAAEQRFGRRHNGTPIWAPDDTSLPLNNFDYRDTEHGSECPVTAHIRKMNPRDADGRSWAIARRGVPYDDGASKGLLFMAFMNSIERQYDRMLANALDASSPDALLTGDEGGRRFVTPIEGAYFVAMPKSFFRSLRG